MEGERGGLPDPGLPTMYIQKDFLGKGLEGMYGRSLVLSTGQGALGTRLNGFEY